MVRTNGKNNMNELKTEVVIFLATFARQSSVSFSMSSTFKSGHSGTNIDAPPAPSLFGGSASSSGSRGASSVGDGIRWWMALRGLLQSIEKDTGKLTGDVERIGPKVF